MLPRVITFLEDRRLLFGPRHPRDWNECVHSADLTRLRLTDELARARVGRSLEEAACYAHRVSAVYDRSRA